MKHVIAMSVLFLLTACTPRAVYIQGGQGASASLDVSAATGSGKIMLTGPFIYCAEHVAKDSTTGPSLAVCPILKAP